MHNSRIKYACTWTHLHQAVGFASPGDKQSLQQRQYLIDALVTLGPKQTVNLGIRLMNPTKTSQFIKTYNYIVFCLSLVLLLNSIKQASPIITLAALACILMALGTILHLTTGKHNAFSKLPRNYRVEHTNKHPIHR